MTFALGNAPLTITAINLNRDADFIATIRTASADPWPDGTTVTLVFDDPDSTTWPASVVADALFWDVDKIAVNELRAKNPQYAQLFYAPAGGEDDLWGSGPVKRNA